jgi:hypothetical protein
MGTEHRISVAGRRASAVFTIAGEERVDVLPDDLLGRGYLKYSTRSTFTDEGVAVGQSLCATDVIAEK